MRRPLALVAVLVLALPAAAEAKTKSFRTPSKNIYCLYVSKPAFLRCDVLSLNDVGFVLGRKRARRIHITDSVVNNRAKSLGYGQRLRLGPFSCRSRRSGLTCKHRKRGHSFTLSRTKQVVRN